MARTLETKCKFPRYTCLSNPCEFCMAAGTDRLSAPDSETDPQYTFLVKYFEELRSFKRSGNWCNWNKTYKNRLKEETKPVKFKDLSCSCNFGMNIQKPENTEEKKQIPQQESSEVSTKSQRHPLAGHSKSCNVNRMNLYFRCIAETIMGTKAHSDLFLLDPIPPVTYMQKEMREIRKLTVLKLSVGIEERLEDWDEFMTDEHTEKWEKRNKVRKFLHYILDNMLNKLIGPNGNESENEDEADDGTDTDPEKVAYQRLKTNCRVRALNLKSINRRSKKIVQDAVILGHHRKTIGDEPRQVLTPPESSSDSDLD